MKKSSFLLLLALLLPGLYNIIHGQTYQKSSRLGIELDPLITSQRFQPYAIDRTWLRDDYSYPYLSNQSVQLYLRKELRNQFLRLGLGYAHYRYDLFDYWTPPDLLETSSTSRDFSYHLLTLQWEMGGVWSLNRIYLHAGLNLGLCARLNARHQQLYDYDYVNGDHFNSHITRTYSPSYSAQGGPSLGLSRRWDSGFSIGVNWFMGVALEYGKRWSIYTVEKEETYQGVKETESIYVKSELGGEIFQSYRRPDGSWSFFRGSYWPLLRLEIPLK